MRHPRSLIALLFALSLAACATTPFETPGVLPAAAYPDDGSPQRSALNAKVYDKAVRHVDRLFYRKDFDRTAFATEAAAARTAAIAQQDEAGFYGALTTVLETLDDDHTYVQGPTVRERRAAHKAGEGRAGYGLVTTLVGEDHIVARVRPEGPAAAAGVLPGWRMARIDDRPVTAAPAPVEGRSARVVFIDEDGIEHAITLTAAILPALPRFELQRLDDGIAWLRFDDFDHATYEWFMARMTELAEAPPRGLVLDLRSNGGGLINIATLINAWFHRDRQRFAVLEGRLINRVFTADVPEHAYTGPLMVLIGPASASASELLAARLQETDRARIVGQKTRGAVVGTRGIDLPDGGLLRVGMMTMTTADGTVLEKIGVTPDIEVATDWPAIRAGRDPVLEQARALLASPREGGALD